MTMVWALASVATSRSPARTPHLISSGPGNRRMLFVPGAVDGQHGCPVVVRAVTRSSNGHEWEPGLITVSWVLCECPPAMAAVPQARPDWAGEFDRVCQQQPR
jgi:hypothetical protein